MFNFPFYSYYPRTLYRRYVNENNHCNSENFSAAERNQTQFVNKQKSNSYTNLRYSTNSISNSIHSQDNRKDLDNEDKNDDVNDDKIFEIFGIKLHFDDILLICLIFFLYNEGVKDEYLFIALILLLLS